MTFGSQWFSSRSLEMLTSAFIWMSRTYWKILWLQSCALEIRQGSCRFTPLKGQMFQQLVSQSLLTSAAAIAHSWVWLLLPTIRTRRSIISMKHQNGLSIYGHIWVHMDIWTYTFDHFCIGEWLESESETLMGMSSFSSCSRSSLWSL